MPDVEPPGWLRSWIATSLASTVYASVGVSAGAILYLVAPYFGGQPWGWFFAGTCIPPGLMALVNTSDWMFYRRLRNLKQLFDDGLSRKSCTSSIASGRGRRADRLYGKAPALPSRPRADEERTKPAITSQPTEAPGRNPAARGPARGDLTHGFRDEPSLALFLVRLLREGRRNGDRTPQAIQASKRWFWSVCYEADRGWGRSDKTKYICKKL